MRHRLALACLLFGLGLASAGEPPLERTIVQAVADADLDRVLVRWTQVDGGGARFTHYDVLRRESDQTAWTQLNAVPIGALATVAEIEALFQQPGYADALVDIQTALGGGYAGALLTIQLPTASDVELLQQMMLPDQNYGVALAFGLGFMDESVVNGTAYVYEIWGLDSLGFRQERLGRAVVTAGSLDLLPQADAECADLGDTRAHMRTFVRWSHGTASEKRYIPGYDLYRVLADGGGQCTNPNGPLAPGAVKVNPFPAQRVAVGRVVEGQKQFLLNCAGCHNAADPRNTPPPSGLQGGTIASFERRVHPELWENPLDAAHDTVPPTPILSDLGPDTVRAVFDWVHEFHYSDDGGDTPADPLIEGETYCYQALPRDLLGQHGAAGTEAACAALDRDPPQVPWKIDVRRMVIGGTHETCEVSWDRNADLGDDTVDYRLYRMANDAPRASKDLPERVFAPDPSDPLTYPPLAILAQPPSGDRVTYQDPGLNATHAGQRFFYAVAATDDAGGVSDFSGWSPCVPRDIVAPHPPVIDVDCCDPGGPPTGCYDLRNDSTWTDTLGGEPIILWDASLGSNCIRISSTQPDDTHGLRLYRSFDGTDYLEGREFKGDIDEDFAPTIDARMLARVRGFDKSGNFSSPSNTKPWIVFRLALPAPQIVDVTPVAHVTLTGLVKIRFHSLPWTNLLGFALYKHNLEPNEVMPQTIGSFVVRHHDNNLSTSQYQPGWWAPQVGAVPLSDLLTTGPPTGADEFLYYDVVKNLYVLQVDVEDTEGLVLNLAAVGWSGREGLYDPYHFGGTPHDGVLDWPQFRTNSHKAFTLNTTMTATYEGGANDRIRLAWNAYPQGCANSYDRPFIVFRRRGNATRWEQISPPFTCDMTLPDPTQVTYYDEDVEPYPDGSPRRHHYTVIRLHDSGEFLGQYGPVYDDVP